MRQNTTASLSQLTVMMVVEVAGDDDDEDNEWFVFADQIQREKKPAACVRMNVLWM